MTLNELFRRNGDPSRLRREGKRELTESVKKFSKASARLSPWGPLWRLGSEGPPAQKQDAISLLVFWNNAHAESARLDLLCAG